MPHIDFNKDSFVSFEELETWITHKMKRWDIKEDAQALYRESDRNFDELVTWDEFCIRQFGFRDSGEPLSRISLLMLGSGFLTRSSK